MKKKRIIQRMIVSAISVGIIAIFGVSSTFADSSTGSVDRVVFNLPTSCTLSSTVDTPHSTTILNGTYRSDIGKSTLTTFCNDENGYIVYAIGSSGNSEGNTDLVSNINSNYNIQTGLAQSGDISNWAMKLNNIEGDTSSTPAIIEEVYNNKYAEVPGTWTKVASRPSGTTEMDKGSSFTTTYSIYTSPTQSAGIYEGKVKYVMLHPSSSVQPSGIEGIVYMQEFASLTPAEKASLMDTMIEDQQYQLRDIRDGKEYWVAKLKDGNVWMTENLDLDLSTNQTLTSMNTDLNLYGSMGYDYANGYSCSNGEADCTGGIISWTPERSTIASGNLNSTTWKVDYNNPYSWQGNEGECPNNPSPDCNDGHSYANNYYNWSAAIASNNSSAYTANNTVAANSICPAGWRLPNAASMTGGYEFSKLFYKYDVTNNNTNGAGYAGGGFSRIINNPLWFVQPGYVSGSTLSGLADYGFYWSSVVNGGTNTYGLNFGSGNVNPANNNIGRHLGSSIRCITK